jgi:hypothetical protein
MKAEVRTQKAERLRRWFRARTARLNARGLTSRGTPMITSRRVYGRSKMEYQRARRGKLSGCGLTIFGTLPKRGLAKPWARFRSNLAPQPSPLST